MMKNITELEGMIDGEDKQPTHSCRCNKLDSPSIGHTCCIYKPRIQTRDTHVPPAKFATYNYNEFESYKVQQECFPLTNYMHSATSIATFALNNGGFMLSVFLLFAMWPFSMKLYHVQQWFESGGYRTVAHKTVPAATIRDPVTVPSEDFHRDAAAALSSRRNPCVDAGRYLVAACRVGTVSGQAPIVLLRTLRDRRVKRKPGSRRAAPRAAPGDQLIAFPATLLLGSLVALELVE